MGRASRVKSSVLLIVVVGAVGCSMLVGGCSRSCGSYTSLTGLEEVVDGDVYDYDRDDMFETCSSDFGAFGTFALDDAELGALMLIPNHRNMKVDTHICTDLFYHVEFDNRSLQVGEELTILGGEAGIYAILSAGLQSGTVEVLDSREADAECEPFREQDFKLAWDLVYGDPSVDNHYTAEGEDWVGISLPMSYGDEGC